MTEIEWKQYFEQKPKEVVEFIQNLRSATNRGWVDSITADNTRQLINFELKELFKTIEQKRRGEEHDSANQWKRK